MPFALVTVGLLLIVTGFQNTYAAFGKQVENDFTGPGNFIYWLIAIGVVGAVGYSKTFETPSRAFIALIIIAMFVKNDSGVFAKLTAQISSGTTGEANTIGAPLTGATGSGSSGGGGNPFSNIAGDVSIAETAASFF